MYSMGLAVREAYSRVRRLWAALVAIIWGDGLWGSGCSFRGGLWESRKERECCSGEGLGFANLTIVNIL